MNNDRSDPPAAMSQSAAEEDRLARVALTWLAEPGNQTVWSMVQQTDAPTALQRLLAGDVADPDLRVRVTARAATGDARRAADVALQRASGVSARLIVPSDDEWPTPVNDLATADPDGPGGVTHDTRPPLCLWVRGDWPLGDAFAQSVSIVGARAASSYGAHVSAELAYGLADRGWTVVSGGAFGVDAAAHRAALTASGGRTIAVLACGLDRPYPAGNATLLDQIARVGLLVSEWPPGAEPLRHRFLLRNRVIAATAGTVVVEAAHRSGSMQMVGSVRALRRPVMVVPGPVTSVMSAGCHEILRRDRAARVVTSVSDVVEELRPAGS